MQHRVYFPVVYGSSRTYNVSRFKNPLKNCLKYILIDDFFDGKCAFSNKMIKGLKQERPFGFVLMLVYYFII